MVRGSWFVARGWWFMARGPWFVARGPAPLLGELSAQLTERLLFNERPAGRQPRLSVLSPLPRPLVGTWRASLGNHTYPEAGRPLGRLLKKS